MVIDSHNVCSEACSQPGVGGVWSLTVIMCALQAVNKAMQKEKQELTIGVLDIYGFEIFMVRIYTHNMYMYIYCIYSTCFNEEASKVKQTTRQSNTAHPR